MYPIPGHLGMSIAGSYLTRLPYTPAILATFIVDVGDKILKDVLDVAPYGRCWMHTLLVVVVCTSLVWYWKGKKWGLSWLMGHLLHLVGDIGFIPWFYPFIDYQWPDAPNVVNASVQGVKETVSGGPYSDTVLSVFKGKLLILEGMILLPAGVMAYQKEKLSMRWKVSLLIILFGATLFRLFYHYPEIINWLSQYVGNWVYT